MQDTPLLSSIHTLKDYKRIPRQNLDELAREIRLYLVDVVSKNGGHLASNLGVVELTMALDWVFSSPADKLIFDVGHQCYIHKLLTGRVQAFKTLRQEGGMAGFPKREESPHDA
ncbi:MAG: 1-deoxy-D-xylulose-5-phosphate synthase, partial [Clostridia bacterium]|nr:1-deoxy-D-xylulose-5-phosphate synthase [Clostridia bacterium]